MSFIPSVEAVTVLHTWGTAGNKSVNLALRVVGLKTSEALRAESELIKVWTLLAKGFALDWLFNPSVTPSVSFGHFPFNYLLVHVTVYSGLYIAVMVLISIHSS